LYTVQLPIRSVGQRTTMHLRSLAADAEPLATIKKKKRDSRTKKESFKKGKILHFVKSSKSKIFFKISSLHTLTGVPHQSLIINWQIGLSNFEVQT
jgi:hypothetical protein